MAEDRDLPGYRDVRNLRYFRLQPLPGSHSLLPVDPLDLYRNRQERRTRSGPLFERLTRNDTVIAKERDRNLRRVQDELDTFRKDGIEPGQDTIDDRMAALQGLLQADMLLELERIDKQFGQKYSQRIRQLRGELKKLRATWTSRNRTTTKGPKPTQRDIQRQVLSTVRAKFSEIVADVAPLIEKAVAAGVDTGAAAAAIQFETLYPDGVATVYEYGNFVEIHYPFSPDPDAGQINAQLDNGDLMISGSFIPSEDRGKGIGVEMYSRLAAYAAKKGIALKSDVTVSAQAQRMYDALERRGFIVKKHPAAFVTPDGNMTTKSFEHVEGFEVEGEGTRDAVFRVEPPKMETSERQAFIEKMLAADVKLPALMSTREKMEINGAVIRGSLIIGEGGAVSLSARLWKDHQQRGRLMAEQIARTIKAGGSSYDIADEIIGVVDSGEFATDAPDIPVPGYISEMVEAARLANLTGDKNFVLEAVQKFEGYVDSLGAEKGLSFSLRSAAKDFLKAIVKAEDDQIDVVLNRFMLDKARIHARMIARTEAVRAYRESYIASVKDKPWVTGIRWKLSHLHPKPDVCDLLANQDLHGLGGGGYPKDNVPAMPHPNDMCLLTGIFNWNYLQDEKDRIRNERDDRAFNMPEQRLTDAQEEALINIVEGVGGLDEALDALKESRFGAQVREQHRKFADQFIAEQAPRKERFERRMKRWREIEPDLAKLTTDFVSVQRDFDPGLTLEQYVETQKQKWLDREPDPGFSGYYADVEKLARAANRDAARKLHTYGILPGGTTLSDFPAPLGKKIYVSGDADLDYDTAIEELKRWHPDPIPDYMETVTVLHATDAATAAKFLQDGIIPQLQPYTLTQLAHRAGEDVQLDPIAGLERGLYVGQYESLYQPASESADRGSGMETRFAKSEVYRQLKGWNDVLLEIQVPKAWLERPAELEGKLDSNVNEALVRHGIPYTDVRLVHASTELPFFDRFLHGELIGEINKNADLIESLTPKQITDWGKISSRGWLTHDDFEKIEGMVYKWTTDDTDFTVPFAVTMQERVWGTVGSLVEIQQAKAEKLGVDMDALWNMWKLGGMKPEEITIATLREALREAEKVLSSMPLAYWSSPYDPSQAREAYDKALTRYMVQEGFPQHKKENSQGLNATGRQLRSRLDQTMYSNEYIVENVRPRQDEDKSFGRLSLGYDRNLERSADGSDYDEVDHFVPPYPQYTYQGPIWKHYNVQEAAEIMRRRPHETYIVADVDYFGNEHLAWRQTGKRYSVAMEDNSRDFQKQHGNTIDMHNHPGGNPPSPPDIMSIMQLNPYETRIAAGNGVDWIARRPDSDGTGSGWYQSPQLGEIYDIQPDGDDRSISIATEGLHQKLNEAWDKAREQASAELADYIESKDPGWKAKVRHIKDVAIELDRVTEERLESPKDWPSAMRELIRVRDEVLPQYKNVAILPVSHPEYDKDVEREILDGFIEQESNRVYADYNLWSVDDRSKGFLIKDEPPERVDRARRERVRYDDHEQGYFDDRLRAEGEELDKSTRRLETAKRYRPPWDGTLQTARAWAKDILKQEGGRGYMLDMLGPTRFNVFATAAKGGDVWANFLGAVIDSDGVPVPVWEMLKTLESSFAGRNFLDALRTSQVKLGDILVPGAVYETNITRAPREGLDRVWREEERFYEDDD